VDHCRISGIFGGLDAAAVAKFAAPLAIADLLANDRALNECLGALGRDDTSIGALVSLDT
jgi:hypothetical protein